MIILYHIINDHIIMNFCYLLIDFINRCRMIVLQKKSRMIMLFKHIKTHANGLAGLCFSWKWWITCDIHLGKIQLLIMSFHHFIRTKKVETTKLQRGETKTVGKVRGGDPWPEQGSSCVAWHVQHRRRSSVSIWQSCFWV